MRFWGRVTLVIALLNVWFAPGPVQSASVPYEWWNRPNIQRSLGLGQDQIEKINQLYKAFNQEQKTITKKLQQLAPALKDPVLDNIGENELNRLLDEYFDLRKKIFKKNILFRQAVKAVLGQEQITKLLADYPDIFSLTIPWADASSRMKYVKQGNIPPDE
ncbi:hypothetical protein JXQ70_15490 [bacterium]|nr:hypothetical protein [bacterium]